MILHRRGSVSTVVAHDAPPSWLMILHRRGSVHFIQGDEVEENDTRDKRERLIACVLSGNSKQYLGKEYTEQQINEMDGNNINILSNRYESVLSAQMTKSLGKNVINQSSDILQHSQNRPTGDRWLKL